MRKGIIYRKKSDDEKFINNMELSIMNGKIFGLYTNEEFDELKEIAKLTKGWSNDYCSKKQTGGMEEWAKNNVNTEDELTCDWYHSTWPIMRLANMVAIPKWYEFYVEALSKVLESKRDSRVMISACADYGMLAKLHKAIIKANTTPEIVIYDICETPLKSSEWYASRHNLKITCKCENILTGDIPKHSFDLIVTDEFLTVLKDDYKPTITDKWHELLAPGGYVVTTAMVGGPTTPELRGYYEKKANEFFDNSPDIVSFIDKDELKEKCANFANFHTRHMIKDEKQLRSLFEKFNNVSLNPIMTPGECVSPTKSYQIVAGV